MRRVVVLGDSLTFHGPRGPLPLADPRLYPNIVARRLADATGEPWEAIVVARAGWCTRDLWVALQKDVHLQQQVLVGCDAVAVAVGGADSLTVGVPRVVNATLPYVRPTPLRRWLRREIDRRHALLVRLTGERLRYTPLSVYRHCWRKSIEGIRLFTEEAPLCALLPAIHAGPYYAGSLRHHHAFRAATEELGTALAVPLVDMPALMEPWMDKLNSDGVHWPYELHADVGDAICTALLPQLRLRRAPERDRVQPEQVSEA